MNNLEIIYEIDTHILDWHHSANFGYLRKFVEN